MKAKQMGVTVINNAACVCVRAYRDKLKVWEYVWESVYKCYCVIVC